MSERSEPERVEVVSAAGAVTAPEVALDERAWSFVQHRNKDYPAAAYQR
jgi:hypothetical protein